MLENLPGFLKSAVNIRVLGKLAWDHSKYIIIDGKMALVADENIQDKPVGSDRYRWLGMVTRITGAPAAGLEQLFKQQYNLAFPVLNAFTPLSIDYSRLGQPISVEQAATLKDGVVIAYSDPLGITHSKQLGDLRDVILNAIMNAKQEVCIITPNLSWKPVIEAIAAAASRGVKIKIILSKNFNNDINLLLDRKNVGDNLSALYYLRKILGDNLKNVEVRWYSPDGKMPANGNEDYTSHAKLIIVDGKQVIHGSANLDVTSFKYVMDTCVITPHAEQYSQAFLNTWRKSIPINLNSLTNEYLYRFIMKPWVTLKALVIRIMGLS